MTVIHDEPETFASTALDGFCSLQSDRVRRVKGGLVRTTATPEGKVALVVGGGSGHYPAFAGFVGAGLADAAVAGDVFASPSTESIVNVARLAHRGGGVILGFGNYAGDVLNFSMAARRLRSEGIETELLAVTDDVASASPDQAQLRRGVAGDLCVFKMAGAAAEAGAGLAEVMRLATLANRRTMSFGVAFSGCTLPGRGEPLFTVPPGRMGVGLGIHGEPGIAEEPLRSASSLADLLVDRLIAERPAGASGRVAAVLNGLGCSKYEELFVLWARIEERLARARLDVVAPEAGEFVTSLDMAGCSLSLTWLDAELESLWLASCDAPVLRRGAAIAGKHMEVEAPRERGEPPIPAASASSRAGGRCIAALLAGLAAAMRSAEDELGRLDSMAGDGDHGQAMSRGSAAASEAAKRACEAGGGAGTVLARAGDAWADRAGGTSGALWGLALRAWGEALGDDGALEPTAIARGATAALGAIVEVGRAAPGDKTIVDAMDPFVRVLTDEVGAGDTLSEAWASAAKAARAGADGTAALAPRLGRARPLAERSIGHRDPGAVSLALCAESAAEFIASTSQGR